MRAVPSADSGYPSVGHPDPRDGRYRCGLIQPLQIIADETTGRGDMVSAREIMHGDVQGVRPDETLDAAAKKMRDLHVGAPPILGNKGELLGIITDRDIV